MKNILNQKIVFFTFFFIKFFLQLFSLRNFFNFSSELLDAPYSFNFFVYNKFKERSSFKNTHPYVIKSFASKNFSKKEYLNLCFFYKNFLQISYKFGDYPYLYASPKFSKKMYFKLLSRLYSTKWIFNRKKKSFFFSKSNEAKFYLKYIDKIDFYKAIGFVKKYNYLIYKNIRYINTPFLISYLNYETYYLHPLVSRWTWGRKRWKKKKNLKKLKNKLYRLRFEKRQKKNFLKKFSSKKNFPLLKNYFILRKLFSSNDLKFLKDFDYLDKLVHYKYGLKKKKMLIF